MVTRAPQTTSLLTIGYGDIVVDGRGADRLLDSLLIVLGLASITIWVACASQWLSSVRSRRVEGHGRECGVVVVINGADSVVVACVVVGVWLYYRRLRFAELFLSSVQAVRSPYIWRAGVLDVAVLSVCTYSPYVVDVMKTPVLSG